MVDAAPEQPAGDVGQRTRALQRARCVARSLALVILVAFAVSCSEPPTPTRGSAQGDLVVVLEGNGTGVVRSDDGAIDCGSDCQATWPIGRDVELAALPEGNAAISWEGACDGANGMRCTVRIDGRTVAVARFVPTFTLDVEVTGPGTVTSDPAGVDTAAGDTTFVFEEGTEVTLTASAGAGGVFDLWPAEGCDSVTEYTCTVAMDAAKSVTATFVAEVSVSTYALTVTVDGDGRVASDPVGIDTDVAGGSSFDFEEGAVVALIATHSSDQRFDAWRGDCDRIDGGTCTVTIDADKDVDAAFSPSPPSPAPSLRPLDTIECAGLAMQDTCVLRVGWTETPDPYRGLEFEMTSDVFALRDATLGNDMGGGCLIASGPAKVVLVCDAPQRNGGSVADLTIERTGAIPATVAVTDARLATGTDTLLAVPGGTLVVGAQP